MQPVLSAFPTACALTKKMNRVASKNSHCSYCGHLFTACMPWPRQCARCGNFTFLNPIPVAVVLVPVDEGLVLIRRGIEPHEGMQALPGGYINLGETWQEAGAREVLEETGIHLDPGEIREFAVRSAEDGTILIFGLAHKRDSRALPSFFATEETTERVIAEEPCPLAFRLHEEMVRRFFQEKRRRKSPIGS